MRPCNVLAINSYRSSFKFALLRFTIEYRTLISLSFQFRSGQVIKHFIKSFAFWRDVQFPLDVILEVSSHHRENWKEFTLSCPVGYFMNMMIWIFYWKITFGLCVGLLLNVSGAEISIGFGVPCSPWPVRWRMQTTGIFVWRTMMQLDLIWITRWQNTNWLT